MGVCRFGRDDGNKASTAQVGNVDLRDEHQHGFLECIADRKITAILGVRHSKLEVAILRHSEEKIYLILRLSLNPLVSTWANAKQLLAGQWAR